MTAARPLHSKMLQPEPLRIDVSQPGPNSDLAQRLRRYLVPIQNYALAQHGVFRIAVSGGSLPQTLGKALLTGSSEELQLGKWHVYLADERAVPLDHEDSNYRLVKEEWIDRIPAGQDRPEVVPLDPSLLDNIDELADDYQSRLVKDFASRDSVVVPIFDLILLGCGPDGHTCSLFPGKPTLATTTRQDWVLPIVDSPKPPPRRITLSMAVVTHASHIAFVATGAGKDEIMHQIFDVEAGKAKDLSEEEEMKLLPCSIVNRHGRAVTWFTDEPAVTKVERRAQFEGAQRGGSSNGPKALA